MLARRASVEEDTMVLYYEKKKKEEKKTDWEVLPPLRSKLSQHARSMGLTSASSKSAENAKVGLIVERSHHIRIMKSVFQCDDTVSTAKPRIASFPYKKVLILNRPEFSQNI
jgi:hypothetical protein